MLYKGQYVPTEVTNFVDPLTKRVEEAKRQIEAWGREQEIHSQNLRDTDAGVTQLDLVKTGLDTLLKTTKVGAQLVQANKQSKAKEENKDKNRQDAFRIMNPNVDHDALFKYTENEKGALILGEGFKDRVKAELAAGNIDQAYHDYLIDASPGELLKHREYLGSEWLTKASWTEYSQHLSGMSPEDKLKWESNIGKHPELVSKDYAEFIVGKFNKLGLDSDFVYTKFGTEIKTQAETQGVVAGTTYTVDRLTLDNEKFEKDIDNTRIKFGRDDNAWAKFTLDKLETFTPIVNDKKDYAGGKRKLENFLVMQAAKGSLSQEELGYIRNGLHGGDVPAGPWGKVLLNEEAFDRIGKIIDAKNTATVTAHEGFVDSRYNHYMALGASNQLTETTKAEALAFLKDNGFDVNSKEYRALENVKLQFQHPDYYKQEKDEIIRRFITGDLKEEHLTDGTIKNTKLQNEMKLKLDNLKRSKNDNNFPEDFKDNSEKYLKGAAVLNVVEGQVIPPTAHPVRDWITQQAERIYMEEYLRAPEGDRDIGTRATTRLNDLLESQGLYIKQGNPGAGLLSSTADNKFPTFHAWDRARRVELTTGSDLNKTFNEINSAYRNLTGPGRNDTERLLSTKGSVLSADELVAISANIDQNGKLKFWPKDVLTKAHYLGVEPSVLVKGQLNAFVQGVGNDEASKLLVEVHGLDKLAENLPTLDIDLRKKIEASGDKNLLSLYQHVGIENFSTNQQRRVLAVIEETSNKRNRLQRLKSLGIKKYPASALTSDEALDEYITKQGLLEPK